MKRVVVPVPGMYGDHHVLRVRETLQAVQGVTDVTASAARRQVAVQFDETVTSEQAVGEALVAAGYPSDAAVVAYEGPERHKDGSSWYVMSVRSTTTENKDREMAGDFRRY